MVGMTTGNQQQNSNADSRPWLAPHRFAPGRSGNPTGRPKNGRSLKERFQEQPPEKKLALIEHIWAGAMSGHTAVGAKYAEMILVHSGEGASLQVNVVTASPMMNAINGLREALGLEPFGSATVIEGESAVLDASPDTAAGE